MRQAIGTIVLVACSLLTMAWFASAQQSADAWPSWAYGFPSRSDGAPPAAPPATGGAAPRTPDTSPKRIPGSAKALTIAQIRDYWDVGDWFPDDHPPMPDVVVHGRQPHVRGCAMCHMPNGKGRPENAPLAGLPFAYFVQQMHDFRDGLRASADTRKSNTALMVEAAKDMTDDEIASAARYFSSMKWTPWIRVVETGTVPKTRLSGNVFFPIPDAGTEPIGTRIIEAPEDTDRFELRDPRSGFVAYVPAASLVKGAALAVGGGGRTIACATCHGAELNGLGPVPGLAGRSPSYLMRQLWDFKQGTRKGAWSPLMTQVLVNLTEDDMLALSAYLASRTP
jgi:cytochrome c553